MPRKPLFWLLCAGVSASLAAAPVPPPYRNFHAAVYIPVQIVERFSDRATLAAEWDRIAAEVHVDHVYVESYRDRVIADGALLEQVKAFFRARGVQVSGGMALSDTENGQFRSFDYIRPSDRDYVARVSAFTARHFDDIILDDFFFANTKTPEDIAAKGSRSWTEFRLALMNDVAAHLVLAPARAANPRVRIVIKYPNWYEHFQGNGYDLDREARLFPGIYTGTETREAAITDQNLQPYESYAIVRYFDHVAPGRNGGGWVDTFDVTAVGRYAEQLEDTLLARAPEITLFNWDALLGRLNPDAPTWAAVAGRALAHADHILDTVGQPLGVAAYKPFQSVGEDYLHNFLGMVGIPIELQPQFPVDAPVVLLTESAAADPGLIGKMKAQLLRGGDVVITSGLLRALQGRGIEDIAEIRATPAVVTIDHCYGAYGAGGGSDLGTMAGERPALIPRLRFITNDAWPIVRTVGGAEGFPLLLMDHYGRGALFVLTVPGNFSDLYRLPAPVLNVFRQFIAGHLPVQLEGPAQVALYAYDNRTFVVQSYLPTPVTAGIAVPGAQAAVRDADSGEALAAAPAAAATSRRGRPDPRSHFTFVLPPHGYRVFRLE